MVAGGDGGESLPVGPGHPVFRVGGLRLRVLLELVVVIQGVHPVKFVAVDYAHVQVTHHWPSCSATGRIVVAFVSEL